MIKPSASIFLVCLIDAVRCFFAMLCFFTILLCNTATYSEKQICHDTVLCINMLLQKDLIQNNIRDMIIVTF